MPANNDLDTEDTDEESNVSKGKSSSTSDQDIDYKAKFQGSSRAVDRLKKQVNDLQDKLENRGADAEIQLSDARIKIKTLEDSLKAKDGEIATATSAREKAEREAAKLKSKTDADSVIATKYPALLPDHLVGDLKVRGDFENDEDYDKYLSRQAAKYGQVQDAEANEEEEEETPPPPPVKPKRPLTERIKGATPTSQYRVADSRKGGLRAPEDIAEEMMTLNGDDPKFFDKRAALERELNEATERI